MSKNYRQLTASQMEWLYDPKNKEDSRYIDFFKDREEWLTHLKVGKDLRKLKNTVKGSPDVKSCTSSIINLLFEESMKNDEFLYKWDEIKSNLERMIPVLESIIEKNRINREDFLSKHEWLEDL